MNRIVDFAVFVREDNIAATSHDFYRETVGYGFVKFRAALKIKMKHSFKPGLRRSDKFCTCQPFAQKHTEIRRDRRILFFRLRQVYSRL